MREIKSIFSANTVKVNLPKFSSNEKSQIIEINFSDTDEDGDGFVGPFEAEKHEFCVWQIRENISKSDFEAKCKDYNDKILTGVKNQTVIEFPEFAKPESDERTQISDVSELKTRHTGLCHKNGYDVRGKDISKLKLSQEELLNLRSDDTTIMSDEQRKIISEIKEKMKNPGLGIKSLHKQGITGKGVNIAVIDNPFPKHSEYAAQVVYSESMHDGKTTQASKHGAAVASLLVGKNIGVAPDAKLYCFETSRIKTADGSYTLEFDAAAIKKVIEINKSLSDKDKISVISLSATTYDKNATGNEAMAQAIKEAQKAGIFVVTVDLYNDYEEKVFLKGADRNPNLPVDDFASYTVSNMTKEVIPPDLPQEYREKILLVPQEHRTIADMYDKDSYEYEGNQGGFSWSVPYFAGVYALAKQQDPNITPNEFLGLVMKTGVTCSENGVSYGKIINPQAILETLKIKSQK